MSSTASLYPSTVASSTQSLAPPGNTASTTSLASKRKKPSDRIPASNCCSSFFYNIPRGSVMVTLPGFAILAIGAILVATFPNRSDNWLDGTQLISLIFLILGGAWPLGGLLFWVGAWCRYRPKAPAKVPLWPAPTDGLYSENPNGGLELVRVHRVNAEGNQGLPANGERTDNGKIFTVS